MSEKDEKCGICGETVEEIGQPLDKAGNCPDCVAEMKEGFKPCWMCGNEFDPSDLYKCERCGHEVCLGCTGDEYPYNVTYCGDCEEEWMGLMLKHNFTY